MSLLHWKIIMTPNKYQLFKKFLKGKYNLHSIFTISVMQKFNLYHLDHVIHPSLCFFFGLNFILQSNACYFQFEFNTLKLSIMWCKDIKGHTVNEIESDMVPTPNIDLLNEGINFFSRILNYYPLTTLLLCYNLFKLDCLYI